MYLCEVFISLMQREIKLQTNKVNLKKIKSSSIRHKNVLQVLTTELALATLLKLHFGMGVLLKNLLHIFRTSFDRNTSG